MTKSDRAFPGHAYDGMSIRQAYKMVALLAIGKQPWSAEQYAQNAANIADAMIAEDEKARP